MLKDMRSSLSSMVRGSGDACFVLTEVLVGLAALLDNLNNTGAESLDGGNVVREDTHVTSSGGDVHLGDGLRREDSLTSASETTTAVGGVGTGQKNAMQNAQNVIGV